MKFSVLMSVYAKDDPDNFRDALVSIWDNQTLRPAQIVLIVDGPISYNLREIIDEYSKKLGDILTVYFNPENLGLAKSLNIGIGICKYSFVARMDSDDVAMPERFALQFDFLEKNPQIDCLGGSIIELNYDFSTEYSKITKPAFHSEIVKYSKFRCPFNHPTVVFRKDSIVSSGGYPLIFPEDYILWVNMILNGFKLANIEPVILKMRTGSDFLRRRGLLNSFGMIKTFWYMYNRGFIGLANFVFASMIHVGIRISPLAIKGFFYRNFR